MEILQSIFNKLGVDKAIAYSFSSRLIQSLGYVLIIVLMAKFLSPIEQGYYYSFSSLLAIQVFFELGLSQTLIQVVAREMKAVHMDEINLFVGKNENISRLSSLFKQFTKWYLILSLLFFITMMIIGFRFYQAESSSIQWQWPWSMLCIFSSLNLLFMPIMSFLQGIGYMEYFMKTRFYQQIIALILSIIVFTLGYGLYAVAASSCALCTVSIIVVSQRKFRRIFYSLHNTEVTHQMSFVKEIWPYQWKISLSWLCGYLIYNIINPIVFKRYGAVVGGQLGMTVAVLSGITTMVESLKTSRIPEWTKMIAMKQFEQIDKSFKKNLQLALSFVLPVMIICAVILYITQEGAVLIEYSKRLLPWWLFGIMSLKTIGNMLVVYWATYTRCHIIEPFLYNTIATAIITVILYVCATYYLVLPYVLAIDVILYILIICPWAYLIYRNIKNTHHE